MTAGRNPTGRRLLVRPAVVDLARPAHLESVANGGRAVALLLALLLTALGHETGPTLPWLAGLLGLALLAAISQRGRLARAARLVEAAGAAAAIVATSGVPSPLFPYVVAPAFAAALVGKPADPLGCLAISAVVLGAGSAAIDDVTPYAASAAEWVVLAAAAALIARWLRHLVPGSAGPTASDASYAAAYRLLAQLRPVARQLSVGLDPGTIAEGLLDALRGLHPFERGAVFVRAGGNRLVPLAYLGTPRLDWEPDVGGEGPAAEAWLAQRPQRGGQRLTGGGGSALVLPLVIGLRSFGLVAVESSGTELLTADPAGAVQLVDEAALRLETALLFDDVRGLATAEERRRVAREIHDGIAQELSYLGYVVDELAADARTGRAVDAQLGELRGEISRIVSELRLSIFDLRSEVDVHGGLGAALSDYVQASGQRAGLTVHLSLSESTTRLPAETEAELLRIAQEAITNARRHAGAENLWVSLVVDPPSAVLRIEDDGLGLGPARPDSYGLQIMRERAARLRAALQIGPRDPHGTAVEVAVRLPDRTSLPRSPAGRADGLEGSRRV